MEDANANVMGDILAGLVTNKDGAFGGNAFVWVIILFFIAWMFGGFNGMRGGNAATQADVNQGFQFNGLDNAVRGNGAAINQLAYDNLAQSNNIMAAIAGVGSQAQSCCCETNRNIDAVRYDMSNAACGINRNIDAVRYEMAQNTCAITTNATANTQKVLDAICQLRSEQKDAEIAALRSDLQAAQLTLGNAAQTSAIIGALKPSPIPAYITASPYASYFGGTTIA